MLCILELINWNRRVFFSTVCRIIEQIVVVPKFGDGNANYFGQTYHSNFKIISQADLFRLCVQMKIVFIVSNIYHIVFEYKWSGVDGIYKVMEKYTN